MIAKSFINAAGQPIDGVPAELTENNAKTCEELRVEFGLSSATYDDFGVVQFLNSDFPQSVAFFPTDVTLVLSEDPDN